MFTHQARVGLVILMWIQDLKSQMGQRLDKLGTPLSHQRLYSVRQRIKIALSTSASLFVMIMICVGCTVCDCNLCSYRSGHLLAVVGTVDCAVKTGRR